MVIPPMLAPSSMTRQTTRIIRTMDRVANGSVIGFAWMINVILAASVRFVLAFDQLRTQADRTLSGERLIDGRWYFACKWCGSKTAEAEQLPLTCCQLESREAMRQFLERQRA